MHLAYFLACKIRKGSIPTFTARAQTVGMISIALGLSVLLMAFLVLQGFQRCIVRHITHIEGHLQVDNYAKGRSFISPPMTCSQIVNLQSQFAAFIQEIQAFAYQAFLLKTAEETEGILFKGLDPYVAHSNLQGYLTAGRFLTFHAQGYSHDLVISSRTATRLQLHVGDEVLAYSMHRSPRCRKLKIVGIYASAIAGIDEKLAFCDIRLIQRLNGWQEDQVGGYALFLKTQNCPAVIAAIRSSLGPGVRMQSMEKKYAALFDWIATVRNHTWVFLFLILLVASFNMASVALVQVMERTAMIGVLKALGASSVQIGGILLWNVGYVLGKGMLVGNVVGIGVCIVQDRYHLIPLDPAHYPMGYVPIGWDVSTILTLNLLTFGVVMSTVLLALAVVARIEPRQAIQFHRA